MLETHVQELLSQGYTLFHGLVAPERLERLRAALDQVHAEEAHVPRQSAEAGCLRGYNLIRRHALFREALQQPEIVGLAEAVLGPTCILHSFESRSALPGGGRQSLHRDMPWVPDTPLSVNVVWMLDDFTEESGATRVVPGSHRRPDGPERDRIYPDEVLALAPAGTLLAFSSHTWHGGGPNRTERLRRAFHVHYCRSWVKPQRDHTRSLDPPALEGATTLFLRLLGYHSQMEFEPERNEHQRLPIPPAADAPEGSAQ